MLASLILALQLVVSPAVSMAPATMNVKLRDIPAEGRFVVWSLVGPDFATQSQWDLHGEKTLFFPQWKEVPQGEYVAEARVYDQAGTLLKTAHATVVVKGIE